MFFLQLSYTYDVLPTQGSLELFDSDGLDVIIIVYFYSIIIVRYYYRLVKAFPNS